jgi:hypothetical protein
MVDLDGDDLSTTEADTPEPEERENKALGASEEIKEHKVSHSFSSLIDYNPRDPSLEEERDAIASTTSSNGMTIKEVR